MTCIYFTIRIINTYEIILQFLNYKELFYMSVSDKPPLIYFTDPSGEIDLNPVNSTSHQEESKDSTSSKSQKVFKNHFSNSCAMSTTSEEKFHVIPFLVGTRQDFIEMGEEKIKNLAVLGFDIVNCFSPILKEAFIKDYQPPQIILDSRNRMYLRWEGFKKLCKQVLDYSSDRFELDRHTSYFVLEAVSGMAIDPKQKMHYQEILKKQRKGTPEQREYLENFRDLSPDLKAREICKLAYSYVWDMFGGKIAGITYNKFKYGCCTKPPKFRNTKTLDVGLVHDKGWVESMTLQEIRNSYLPNAVNRYDFRGGKCIFAEFEWKGKRYFKIVPENICNHAELIRLPNGEFPLCFTAGKVCIENGRIPSIGLPANNASGHILAWGEHLPKYTTHSFHLFGLTEMKESLFQLMEPCFSFNPERGFIKSLQFKDLVEGCEYQYVLVKHPDTPWQFKVGPIEEVWLGKKRTISLAELALGEGSSIPNGVEAAGRFRFTGKELTELTNEIISRELHHHSSGWRGFVSRELSKFGFEEISYDVMRSVENRFPGGVIHNLPIHSSESSIPDIAFHEVLEKLTESKPTHQNDSVFQMIDSNTSVGAAKTSQATQDVLGCVNPPKIKDAYKFISENHPTILVIPPKPNFEVSLDAVQSENGFTASFSITNDRGLTNIWNEQTSRMSKLNELTKQHFFARSDQIFSEITIAGAKAAQEKAIVIFKEFEKFCKEQPSADLFQKKYEEFSKLLQDNINHFYVVTAFYSDHPEIKRLGYWYHDFFKEFNYHSIEYKYFALIKQNQFIDAQNLIDHLKNCGENFKQLSLDLQIIQNISKKHFEKSGKNLFKESQNEKTHADGSEESLTTASYHQKLFSTLAKERIPSKTHDFPEEKYKVSLQQKYLEQFACEEDALKKYCGLDACFWLSRENYQKINEFLNHLNGKELAELDATQVNDFFNYVNDSQLYDPNHSINHSKTGDAFQKSIFEFKALYEFYKSVSAEKNVVSLLQALSYQKDSIKYDIILKRIGSLITDLCLAGQKEAAEQYLEFIKDGLPEDEKLQKLQEKFSDTLEKLNPEYERCIFVFENLFDKNKLCEKLSEKGDQTFHDLLKIALSACEIHSQQKSGDFKNKINQVLQDITLLSNKEIQNSLLNVFMSKLLRIHLPHSSKLAMIQEVLGTENPLFQIHPALHKALKISAESFLAYSKGAIDEALRILNTNYNKKEPESRTFIESAYDELLLRTLSKLDKKAFDAIFGEQGLKQCNPEKNKSYQETLKPVSTFLSAKSQFEAFHELETHCVDKNLIISEDLEPAKSREMDIENRTQVTKNPFLRTAFCAAIRQRVDFFSSIEGSAASAINSILNDDHLPYEFRKWGRRLMAVHNIHPEIVGQAMLYLSHSDPWIRKTLCEAYKDRFSSTSLLQAIIGALNETDCFKSESLKTLEKTLNIFNFFYQQKYSNISSLYGFVGPAILTTFEEEMFTRFGIILDNDFIHFMHSSYAQQVLNLYSAYTFPDPNVSCYMGLIALGSLAVGFAGMIWDGGWGESVSLTRIENVHKYLEIGNLIEASKTLKTVKQKHLSNITNKAQFIFAKSKVLLHQNRAHEAILELDLQFIRTITDLKLRNSLANLRVQTLLNTSPSDIKNINHSIALLDKSNTLALQSLGKLSKINGFLLAAAHFKFLEEQVQAALQTMGASHSLILPIEIFRQGMSFLMDSGKEVGLLSVRMPFILAKLYLHHSEIEVRYALDNELRMISQMNSAIRENLINLYGSLKSLQFDPKAIAKKLLEFTLHSTPETLKVLMSIYRKLDAMTRLPLPNQNLWHTRPASISRFAVDLKKVEFSLSSQPQKLIEQKQLIEFFDAVSLSSIHPFPDYSKALDVLMELKKAEGKSWCIARDQIINMPLLENLDGSCNPFEQAWRTANPKRLKIMQKMRVELLSDKTDSSQLLFPPSMLEKMCSSQINGAELLSYIKTRYADQYHLVKSLFKSELKSLTPNTDLLDIYEIGLVAFGLALAKYDKANHIESYYYLEIALECGFKPDFMKYIALALFKTTNHLDLITIHRCLKRFKFKEWTKHKQFDLLQVVIASEQQNHASRSSQELYCYLSQKIRSRIGSPKLDNKLKELIISYKGKGQDYGTYQEKAVIDLLEKGANPDQQLSNEPQKEYLLHKLAKIEFDNIIHLFCEFGADIHVLNAYNMNALESFFASRMEFRWGNTFAPETLLLAGIKANETLAKKRQWSARLAFDSLKNSERSFAGYTTQEIIKYKKFEIGTDLLASTREHIFYLYNPKSWNSPYIKEF